MNFCSCLLRQQWFGYRVYKNNLFLTVYIYFMFGILPEHLRNTAIEEILHAVQVNKSVLFLTSVIYRLHII